MPYKHDAKSVIVITRQMGAIEVGRHCPYIRRNPDIYCSRVECKDCIIREDYEEEKNEEIEEQH